MEQPVSVYVTAPDIGVARTIARALLDQRLIACANILPATSLYRWEGEIHEETEVVMFLKTRRALLGQIEVVVLGLHPHKIPCIVACDLVGGHLPYLAWLNMQTVGPPADQA